MPDQPFSPDGKLVAVHSSDVFHGGSTRVLTLSTGAGGDLTGVWLTALSGAAPPGAIVF